MVAAPAYVRRGRMSGAVAAVGRVERHANVELRRRLTYKYFRLAGESSVPPINGQLLAGVYYASSAAPGRRPIRARAMDSSRARALSAIRIPSRREWGRTNIAISPHLLTRASISAASIMAERNEPSMPHPCSGGDDGVLVMSHHGGLMMMMSERGNVCVCECYQMFPCASP